MPFTAPYPDLDELLKSIGEAGRRVSEIEASEGAAGNLSVYVGWEMDPRRTFPIVEPITLPVKVPALAGHSVILTGSGRRLREVIEDPLANLGFLTIDDNGETGQLYTSPRRLFAHLTSEMNSHLALHQDQVSRGGLVFHAVVHAQPRYVTYLSHIEQYRDQTYFNRHLLRWEPEMIVNLPEGVGVTPFQVPGSPELMAATMESLRSHTVTIWSKHGLVARSDLSIKRATDRIEYVEAAAHYEYLDLANHQMADGLLPEEIRAICKSLGIEQTIF